MLTYKELIDFPVWKKNKVLHQLTQATFLYAPEKTLREKNHQKSKHEDIHHCQRSPRQTTGPNHAGFSPLPR